MKLFLFLFLFMSYFTNAQTRPHVIISTNFGEIEVELYQKKSPITVENFLSYVDEKFYDQTIFHRVIENFMIQGGGLSKDFIAKKTHGAIKNEAINEIKNTIGTLAMARTKHKHTATSQFFINVRDNPTLNYKGAASYGYAVFGKVVKGMDVVNKIQILKTSTVGLRKDVPIKNVIIKTIRRM